MDELTTLHITCICIYAAVFFASPVVFGYVCSLWELGDDEDKLALGILIFIANCLIGALLFAIAVLDIWVLVEKILFALLAAATVYFFFWGLPAIGRRLHNRD
jgi:hypothetical protein